MFAFLFFIIFIPIVSSNAYDMREEQTIHIIWVDTQQDYWTKEDKTAARQYILRALDWWEEIVVVSLSIEEETLFVDADPLSYDVCSDRSWLPSRKPLSIYMIAVYPTQRALVCSNTVNVYDYTQFDQRAIFWGSTVSQLGFEASFVHTIGHLFRAKDGELIMDGTVLDECYKQYKVANSTLQEMGAVRRFAWWNADSTTEDRRHQRRNPAITVIARIR